MNEASSTPTAFGKYVLDREIARGGMARVHLARLRGLGGFEKRLVVKQVRPELARDPRFVSMFVEEAKTLVQLNHPHIVPIYELGVWEGTYFIAMEYVDGATLTDVVHEKPLEWTEIVQLGIELSDALAHAHERFGIVHRDITPGNVMIDTAGHFRLLDFGIATRVEGTSGELWGTPGFLSPEQARGDALGPPSDIFSLAAALFFAATGDAPFPPDVEVTRALRPLDVPRLAEVAGCDVELASVIERALAPDPRERPKSAREFGRALRQWLASRHPEGMGPELGLRAERARTRIEQRRASQPPPYKEGDSHSTAHAPEGATRSIARSAALQHLVGDDPQTAPLDRSRSPSPVARPTVAISRSRKRKSVFAGAILLTSTAALWALSPERATHSSPHPRVPAPVSAPEPPPVLHTQEILPSLESVPDSPSAEGGHQAPTPGRIERPEGAQLSVVSRTWALVKLDGRELGATPLRNVAIRPGVHVLRVENEALGRSGDLRLRAGPGERLRATVDFGSSPVHIELARAGRSD